MSKFIVNKTDAGIDVHHRRLDFRARTADDCVLIETTEESVLIHRRHLDALIDTLVEYRRLVREGKEKKRA